MSTWRRPVRNNSEWEIDLDGFPNSFCHNKIHMPDPGLQTSLAVKTLVVQYNTIL